MRILLLCSYVYSVLLLVCGILAAIAAAAAMRYNSAIVFVLLAATGLGQALYVLRMKYLLNERQSFLSDTLDGELSFEPKRELRVVQPGRAMIAFAAVASLGALFVLYWTVTLISSGAMAFALEVWYMLFLLPLSVLAVPTLLFNLRTWNSRFVLTDD